MSKVLSGIEYDKQVIQDLEATIEGINTEAVAKSGDLQRLKEHLTQLAQTFQGAGNVEITPFPKKVRDLSKNFSVHFGDTNQNTFAMEYHGMGTRSWASMLTVRAFVDTLRAKHEAESNPFFPVLAAEEPEAHLHPNAQKTLFLQLADTSAQVIVSTHSPYVVAVPDVTHLRSLVRTPQGIVAKKLDYTLSADEKKKIAREILERRGDILFSRALILGEGITEEQLIPAKFECLSGKSLFSTGVSVVGVGGVKNYSPFIKLAISFGIPVFIVGDNDKDAKSKVEAQIQRLRDDGVPLNDANFGVSYLADTNDIEGELVNVLKVTDEVKEALFRMEIGDEDLNGQALAAKKNAINILDDAELLKRMRSEKTRYASFLVEVIRDNPNGKPPSNLVIQAVKDAYTAVSEWITS